MKHISRILYSIGIPIFIAAIITTAVAMSMQNDALRVSGIICAFIGGGFIGSAFFFDFRRTMVLKETAGDEFTLMSKERLIYLLDEAGVEYDEGKGREYYLYMVREHLEYAKVEEPKED